MAFKKVQDIESERYGKYIRLTDDGNSITGVFLYKNFSDVLIAECHYIKGKQYNGYVHCCGSGCPACAQGIRVQQKLFIPFLVLADKSDGYDEDTVIFWDRNSRFVHQLRRDVFNKYESPEDYVFRITRHGGHNDINTTYSISAVYTFKDDVDQILSNLEVSLDDYAYYEKVVKTMDPSELMSALSDDTRSTDQIPAASYSYQATPRKVTPDPEDIDESSIPLQQEQESESEKLPPLQSEEKVDRLPVKVDEDIKDNDECEPVF